MEGHAVDDAVTAPGGQEGSSGSRERWQERAKLPLAVSALVFLLVYATPILWPAAPVGVVRFCHVVQVLTYLAFVGDYLMRLSLSGDRKGFVRHSGLDVLVLALPVLQPLRTMQLITLLRVLDKRIGRTLRGRIGAYLTFATVVVTVVGALAVLEVERPAPGGNIRTLGDALWWAVTTITTVGYGEHHPVTTQGRVVAACLMFSGIALLSVVTGAVASWILERMREEDGEKALENDLRREVEELTRQIRTLNDRLDREPAVSEIPPHR